MKKIGKRNIAIALIALVIICVIFVFTKLTKKTTYIAEISTVPSTDTMLALDSDGDGLKDWEEELWKTDRENPDSDGDGSPDGSEIKLGRNPLLAGPNDKLDSETVYSKINTETDEDLTDTDKFSRELFIKIIAGKQSTTPPTEADFVKFLEETIKNETNSQKLKAYQINDLSIDTSVTNEKIKKYGNQLASLLTKKPAQPLEYELDIFYRAEQNKDPSELKKLEPLITAYKQLEGNLLKIIVPENAASLHLSLLNATAGMAWSITGLKYVYTDPIKSLPGISAYTDNAGNFLLSAQAFKKYFDTAGIVFEVGDSGYQFFDAI